MDHLQFKEGHIYEVVSEDKKIWTKPATLMLISQYEQYPELWDTSCVEYKNKLRKKAALKQIAKDLDTNEAEIARKLHNLRTQFNQEIRKIEEKYGHGPDETHTSKWEYFLPLMGTMRLVADDADDDHNYNATPKPKLKRNRKSYYLQVKEEQNVPSPEVLAPSPLSKVQREQRQSPDEDEWSFFGKFVASELRSMNYLKNKRELKRVLMREIIMFTERDDEEHRCSNSLEVQVVNDNSHGVIEEWGYI